jgi:hypothetical protein
VEVAELQVPDHVVCCFEVFLLVIAGLGLGVC